MAGEVINNSLRQVFGVPTDLSNLFVLPFNKASKGTPSDFLINFLGRPASFLNKKSQWVLIFDNLQMNILPAISIAYEREPGGIARWNTEAAARVITSNSYQQDRGCLFCQAIAIPGESGNVIAEGNIKNGALIRGFVGAGRNDFPSMRMSFIDTNISFADSFLRGWSLATSHFGMVAQDGTRKNYRTNATLFRYSITPNGPSISARYTFEGICCTSIAEEELSYDVDNTYVRREAQFSYHNYSLDTVTDMDKAFIKNSRV